DDVVQTTVGDLLQDAGAVAAGLWALGVHAGDRVAIHLPNWREALLLYLGALRIGAVSVPIVPTCGDVEARFILMDSGARVLFCPDRCRGRDYASQCREYLAEGLIDALIPVEPLGDGESTKPWRSFLEAGATAKPLRAADPDALAFIIYTSGTTSAPK